MFVLHLGIGVDERIGSTGQDQVHGLQGCRRPARPPETRYDDFVQLGEGPSEEGAIEVEFHAPATP